MNNRVLFVAVAALLALAACNKEKQEPAQEPAAAPAAAPTAAPAAAQPAAAQAQAAATGQQKALEAMAKSVDPAKAPPEVKKMVEYLNGLTKAIADNMPDCEKAAAAAAAFAEKNQADMEAVSAKMEQMQKNPHSPEALEISRYMMALMLPNLMKMQATMKEFSSKCAAQAEQVGKLLGGIKAGAAAPK